MDDERGRGSANGGGGGGDWAPPADRAPGPDRTPPQDVAAEQCVLGGMILSKDAIADVVEVVRSTDFYRPAHATIFDTILDLYGRGEPADAITVAAALENAGELARVGGGAYLHTLMSSVPTAANAGYYARIVADRAKLRRLVEVGTRIVQMGYGSAQGTGRDVDDVVDMAQQAVYDLTERRAGDEFSILAELLQPTLDEIEAGAAREEGVLRGVPTGFADLDKLLSGLHPGQLIVVAGRPGLGKALALDTPLPTPSGWTTMGEVQVGDRLLAADGRPTRVVALSEIMVDRPCYEVEFSDGSVIVADAGHRWLTRTRRDRRAGRGAERGEVRTTEEIRATLRTRRGPNHTVTNAAALRLPTADLLVAPYLLGVWLGAGQVGSARFVSGDRELVAAVETEGYVVRDRQDDTYQVELLDLPAFADRACAVCGAVFTPTEPQWTVCGTKCSSTNARCDATVRGQLRGLGVLTTKHIPADYLRGSEDQRRALLAGLLDAAGTVDTQVRLRVRGRRFAEGVAELLASLGYHCSARTAGEFVEVSFATADEVFRLERKRLEHKECVARRRTRLVAERHIVAVRATRSVPVRCVSVDNGEHLFLAGRAMIPTHNSTVSMDFARAASVSHGMASAIFSLEMSRIEITMRLLSAEAKVPLHVLRSGRLSDDDWTRLARRMGEISEAPIFVDDTPSMTLMEIRAKARRMRQRHDLKLVVVDYLQLMTSPKRVESRQQEVADLSRGLKLLAKEIECPVIAVSQLNRGPEQRTDKRPQLSDLRESGSIEQDADVVILLHRDDYYDKESPRAGEADFIVAKHRNGPTDTVTVAAQLHYSRFMDMAIS